MVISYCSVNRDLYIEYLGMVVTYCTGTVIPYRMYLQLSMYSSYLYRTVQLTNVMPIQYVTV